LFIELMLKRLNENLMDNLWLIDERRTCADQFGQIEALFTVGNGYVGVRGLPEEGYAGTAPEYASTLVHGVFNFVEGDLSPDLAPVPEWLGLRLKFGRHPFRLDRGRLLGYERQLDLKTATLRRTILWQSPSGDVIRLAFERFTSRTHEHLLALRVKIEALHGAPRLTVQGGINTAINTVTGFNHWQPWQTGHTGTDEVWVQSRTGQDRYELAMQAALLCSGRHIARSGGDAAHPQVEYSFNLSARRPVTIVKLVALHTTRDTDQPLAAARTTLSAARQQGYDRLYKEHCRAWDRVWDMSDIEISGDEFSQQAIRFSLYHVLIAAPQHDEQVNIGAKTLSGPGYRGHAFWDTELFMVPPLTATQPRLSRNLMMYRYHRLAGARAKAIAEGYQGAMFPWESDDTGEEVTPKWTPPDAKGKRIRIWTGDLEQHVTSDIAYAMLEYWRWTGDDDFMRLHGAEVILDGARFWASRVEWKAEHERYEIHHVIGPDEYHEDVNNSVFTNRMARWHLESALEVWDWLNRAYPDDAGRLVGQLNLSDADRRRWQEVIQRLYIPFDPDRQIHIQCDGFFDLQPVDVLAFEPRVASLQSVFGYENTRGLRVIKQADVVMLIALLGNAFAPRDVLINNWNTYYPVCDHGSSLSPAVHAWVAARLGLDHLAWDLFQHAAGIDLEDNKGNSRDGIHGAACGGLWQAIVFGFAGLRLTNKGPVLDPRLPAHWQKLRFSVSFHGQTYRITLLQGGEAKITKR
jgi:kojibiose phosphorylase